MTAASVIAAQYKMLKDSRSIEQFEGHPANSNLPFGQTKTVPLYLLASLAPDETLT